MALPIRIEGVELKADCDNAHGEEKSGLISVVRPLKTYTSKTVFATNDDYGREMAQDGAFGAGAVLIHDGTDAVAWTMSEPIGGKWTANSTDRPYSTAKSLKCDNPNEGDVMQVINNLGPGNDIILTGNYVAISMWTNVDKDWKGGDSFSVYAYLNGSMVGNKVYLEDYFDFDNYDIYQFINIPLADMGIDTLSIDAFRIENEAREGGKSPKFYIDDWELQAVGAPIDFTIEPDSNTWFHIKGFQTTFVDVVTADNADSTMHQLSYDKILAITPITGYIYKQYTEGNSDPIFEVRITNLMDLLSLPFSKITNTISNGTNTLITISNIYPDNIDFVLKYENLDKIVYTVEDKFDDFLYFRISCLGFVEQRD